jgi:hypothetical protein
VPRKLATVPRLTASLAASGLLAAALAACGGSGKPPAAAAPCPLLTAAEISSAAGATFKAGRPETSDANHAVLGCWYSSPKGYAVLWSWRGAGPGARAAPACSGRLQQADGSGYRGFFCKTSTDVQTMYVAKGNYYLDLEIGAGAAPGAARTLGALAATRLP